MKKINEIKIKRIADYDTDLSYLGTFSDKQGEYSIEHIRGERNSYKYFNADNVSNMEEAEQNYKRIMKYETGNLMDYGVEAEAVIYTSDDGGKNWLINKISSGGLWGLSSDGDEADFEAEENQQMEDLKITLKEFGFIEKDYAGVPINRVIE